jgi:hypothetical protein
MALPSIGLRLRKHVIKTINLADIQIESDWIAGDNWK